MMKKVIWFCALLSFTVAARAQSGSDDIKIHLDVGYANPTKGYGVSPGVALAIEPQTFLTNNLAMGVRFEGDFIGYTNQYDDELFSYFGSTSLTFDYYFTKSRFKPFIGGGGGLFTRHYVFSDDDYSDDSLYGGYGTIKLGLFYRAGFEIGPIRFSASYNIVGYNFSYSAFTIGYIFRE
jgi:hypothetical protein